jgi:hypothetical protein
MAEMMPARRQCRVLRLLRGSEFGVEGEQFRCGAVGDEGDHGVARCSWTSENTGNIKR